MLHKRTMLVVIFSVFSAGCYHYPPVVYPETPPLRADELLQRAAEAPDGLTVSNNGADGRFVAEATVLKSYEKRGRSCKDIYKKIQFENKEIENKNITICFFTGQNPGWYIDASV